MKKTFISFSIISIVFWVVGLLFLDVGLEVHLFLIMAGLSFSLNLLNEELKKGK
ncbi:MAG: hypothetical protein WDZ45_04960 [Flavobacteriaceae bacterium]